MNALIDTATLVTIPMMRSATQAFILVKPDYPVTAVILFAGTGACSDLRTIVRGIATAVQKPPGAVGVVILKVSGTVSRRPASLAMLMHNHPAANRAAVNEMVQLPRRLPSSLN